MGERGHSPRGSIRDLPPLVRQPRLIDGKGFSLYKNYRPLDHVLQLAHVARPVVSLQQLQRMLFDIANDFPYLFRVAVDQILDENGDVSDALAQGREADGNDI